MIGSGLPNVVVCEGIGMGLADPVEIGLLTFGALMGLDWVLMHVVLSVLGRSSLVPLTITVGFDQISLN